MRTEYPFSKNGANKMALKYNGPREELHNAKLKSNESKWILWNSKDSIGFW